MLDIVADIGKEQSSARTNCEDGGQVGHFVCCLEAQPFLGLYGSLKIDRKHTFAYQNTFVVLANITTKINLKSINMNRADTK